MTEQEARRLIEGQRKALDLDPEMRFESAQKAIVAYTPDPRNPGPVEDRIAWVLVYSCDWGFVEIHVDDKGGDILAVRRSA